MPNSIETMKISEAAKHQLRELNGFCVALGGKVERIHPPERGGPDYQFATLWCHLPEEKRFSEIRRTGAKVVLKERETDEWYTAFLHKSGEPTEFRPEVVVFSNRKGRSLTEFYLGSTGIDIIEGDIRVRGFDANVQRNGKYVNIGIV